jgi:hypothetical protein
VANAKIVTFLGSVADPGCLSLIQGQKDSGSASKDLSILTQKIVSKRSEI